MRSVRYQVLGCKECGRSVLAKLEFLEFEEECCVDLKNLRVLKEFNDEQEARTYLELSRPEE